jgi:hypothetical protein
MKLRLKRQLGRLASTSTLAEYLEMCECLSFNAKSRLRSSTLTGGFECYRLVSPRSVGRAEAICQLSQNPDNTHCGRHILLKFQAGKDCPIVGVTSLYHALTPCRGILSVSPVNVNRGGHSEKRAKPPCTFLQFPKNRKRMLISSDSWVMLTESTPTVWQLQRSIFSTTLLISQ